MQVAPTNHGNGGSGHGGVWQINSVGDGVRGSYAMNPDPLLFVFKGVLLIFAQVVFVLGR